ncbi:alkylation response protein AidB-like acyl-CoA dehydrogenase [Mycolicibacterium sp. BK556]|uniref:acyl-CoA dehydrogenase family protein n=1 Tax=unclassified Mycolicibacterium TaxID=2636767 RepID=UPI00160BD401|nr:MULTISPECIES: acyl-CoA dehydrogenase family protein [unclassified Mycolicibacterium]MBB3603716.1 alkylation response protein AidB-like acyl-CoA dehydrogenase [Mycolicibacterium sp. BK556]MBB3633911.1 alkylation response protein AidB-like acyl-CoA dehydrogenase [Mycolicibacterium sp. BK607]
MQRMHYDDDHLAFGELAGDFAAKEIAPHIESWEDAGIAPREVFAAAGAVGLLGFAAPEQFGGLGIKDFRYNQILIERCMTAHAGNVGLSFAVHNDICLPYLADIGNSEQQQRWLPGFVRGELIAAIGMTEPGAGSDVAGIRTSAVDAGDHFIVNGAKTFITNGQNADLVITAVRTSPDRHRGLTLMVIERGMAGFERGRNLDKLGLHCQDTSELSFTDVAVPKANVLGEVGRGFEYLMRNLAQERMQIAVGSLGRARAALQWTIDYVRERVAFGKPIGALQNTRFALADAATEVEVAEAFVDRCVIQLNAGLLTAADAAKAKLWATEMEFRVLDGCQQLFGGYGYMREYPIARAAVDARVTRVYGGTSEIMREIIGRDLALDPGKAPA